MTTLLISENFPPATGGSSRWLYEIYRRLPRADLRIIAGSQPDDHAFDRTTNLPLQRLPLTFADWGVFSLTGYRDYAAADRALEAAAFRSNVHTIHCGRILPEGYLAWRMHRRHGIPYACFVHGEEMHTASTSRQLTFMARRVLTDAALIIANSHNTAACLKQDWPVRPDQLAVLHPGVDAEQFAPAPRSAEVRDRLGWGDRPVILTVGRLQKRKGHDKMIPAMRRIVERVPQALFAVVGDGAEAERLQQLARHEQMESHVQWMGRLSDDDLIAAYQQCDLFVLANRDVAGDFEGFGMVLLEAQSCGKPVVAGASGGTAETMIPGATGLLTHAEDPDALADTLVPLLLDAPRRAQMGHAARQWIVDHFDWPVLAEELRQIIGSRFRHHRRAA